MHKFSINKIKRFGSALLAFFFVVLTIFTELSVLVPQKAAAANSLGQDIQQNIATFDTAWGAADWCGYYTNANITTSQYTSAKKDITKAILSSRTNLNVSKRIDNLLGNGSGETINCESFLKNLLVPKVYKSPENALNQMFGATKNRNGDYPSTCQPVPGQSDFCVSKIKNDIKSWANSFKASTGIAPYIEIYQKSMTLDAFKQCYQYNDPANPDKKTDISRWKSNGTNNKSVGYLTEVYVEGKWGDGKANCQKIHDKVASQGLLTWSESNQVDEVAKQQRLSKVTSMLVSNPSAYNKCVVAFLGPDNSFATTDAQKSLYAKQSVDLVSNWLNDGGDLTHSQDIIVGRKTPLSKSELSLLKTCLFNGYSGLQPLLDQPLPDSLSSGSNSNGTSNTDTCESVSGAFGWILCGAIKIISGALNWLDDSIGSLLAVSTKNYNDNLYTAWAGFKNIGLVLLVVMLLVMVIGTAVGFGAFDSYTVKKAAPRMVVGIIFILLSWWICMFAIGTANTIGNGVSGLMTSAVQGCAGADSCSKLTLASMLGADGGTLLLNGGAAVGLTVGVIAFLGFYLTTALLFALVAFLVLLARQLAIMVLVLMAPLAILSWIFPNNNKIWKFWSDTFIKLLLMYPLIMLLISSGKILAYIVGKTGGGF